jgi:hypothetical protein
MKLTGIQFETSDLFWLQDRIVLLSKSVALQDASARARSIVANVQAARWEAFMSYVPF